MLGAVRYQAAVAPTRRRIRLQLRERTSTQAVQPGCVRHTHHRWSSQETGPASCDETTSEPAGDKPLIGGLNPVRDLLWSRESPFRVKRDALGVSH
jgi:hypothetical protein